MSLCYIYSNIRVVTNANDTVRSTFCVSVTHFKINDVLLYSIYLHNPRKFLLLLGHLHRFLFH